MSDDRLSLFPTGRHRNYRWGVYAPQRAFLVALLCVPFFVPFLAHAQGTAVSKDPAQTAHGDHVMHGGSRDPMPAPPDENGAAAKSGGLNDAPVLTAPATAAAPASQGFAPNVTGASLAPGIQEEEANSKFGIDGALASARTNTSQISGDLAPPVDVGVTFSGPLWAAKKQRLESTVRGYGSVEINEDTLHDAVITQSGVVRGLYVFPGMEVKAGDPLTSIYSPERVNAQHMLLADFSKDEGNQISLQYYSSFSSSQKYLDQSRSNLRWWGFSDADIDTLLKTEQVREDYVFQADQDSFIVETLKNPGAVVVTGEKSEENFVIPGEQIMRMARLDTVWGMGFVNPEDDDFFKLGDTLAVTVGEGARAKSLQGLIVHKHDNADPVTRRADFHVLLENHDRSLAPGSLVRFSKQVLLEGIWIPTKALLFVGGRPTVIRGGSNGYEAVNVAIGSSSGDLVRILGGLKEGDQVLAVPRTELDPDARLPGLVSWE